MSAHVQLTLLRYALSESGWVREAGNAWRSGPWTLRTAYTNEEVTLQIIRDHQAEHRARSSQRYYRGSDPVTWLKTEASPAAVKNLVKALDKLSEPA